jgi:hypothetical protein
MLEALTQEDLRARLGFTRNSDGSPAVASVARAARTCVANWRSPPRARVTAYLHRQLAAARFDEELARERVRQVVDALIDVGDFTQVRLDGSACLVLSRGALVRIGPSEFALLGEAGASLGAVDQSWRYVRAPAKELADTVSVVEFADWLGPAGFRAHLARRSRGSGNGTIREFWAILVAALRDEGSPVDPTVVRALTKTPDAQNGYFGRHNQPTIEGRWTAGAPAGIWCAVRPGRNANEWHPILFETSSNGMTALDLFSWDEWNWALLARASALGPAERSEWSDGMLAFQHPIPNQFLRAMRLLGGPGERPWQWRMSEAAFRSFDAWRSAEV